MRTLVSTAEESWLYRALAMSEFGEGRLVADPACRDIVGGPVAVACASGRLHGMSRSVDAADWLASPDILPARALADFFGYDDESREPGLPDIDAIRNARDEAPLHLYALGEFYTPSLSPSAGPDFAAMGADRLREFARGSADQFEPGEAGHCDPYEADWTYRVDYPVDALPSHLDAVWLERERRMFHADGMFGRHDEMLFEPIAEPVHVLERDGLAHLWDGNHRAAAARFRGDKTLGAIVGRPRPDPVPMP